MICLLIALVLSLAGTVLVMGAIMIASDPIPPPLY